MITLMKKFGLALGITIAFTNAAHAACGAYEAKPRYWSALQSIAKLRNESLQQLCRHNGLLDVYATASQIITPKGDVIPHTRVELVYGEHVCQYMISDVDQSLTSEYCYSSF